MKATAKQGVDIVLNSLSGEARVKGHELQAVHISPTRQLKLCAQSIPASLRLSLGRVCEKWIKIPEGFASKVASVRTVLGAGQAGSV